LTANVWTNLKYFRNLHTLASIYTHVKKIKINITHMHIYIYVCVKLQNWCERCYTTKKILQWGSIYRTQKVTILQWSAK